MRAADLVRIAEGHPHPGQRYRHGWIPVGALNKGDRFVDSAGEHHDVDRIRPAGPSHVQVSTTGGRHFVRHAADTVQVVSPDTTPSGLVVPRQPASLHEALADAQTIDDIARVAEAESERITGRVTSFDWTGSDPQIAREHSEGILRGMERYPGTYLGHVGLDDLEPGVLGLTTWFEGYRDRLPVIDFSRVHSSDPDRYRGVLWRSSQRGPDGRRGLVTDTPAAVALHEFGHVVSANYQGFADIAGWLANKAAAGQSEDRDVFLARELSKHGVKSVMETAAEAFADVMEHGDGASELSKAIVARLDKGIAELGPQ